MDDSALLTVDKIKKYYRIRDKTGKKSVLRAVDDVSLSIARGETLGLVGESGCGKTTLGRSILRLIEPDGGSILYDGKEITHTNMRPYRAKMQIIFQDHYGSLDPRCRIIDIIAEGLRVHRPGYSKNEIREKVVALLDNVGLDPDIIYRYPHEFSGGQQQRIGIARALAVDPEFIVCDEPVSSLDVSYQAQIINLLMALKSELGLTYLFISHDLSVVRHISDNVGVMYLGKLVEYGASDEVVLDAFHPYTRALLEAIPTPDPVIGRTKEHKLIDESADFSVPITGCRYCNLCEFADPICFEAVPVLTEMSPGHLCACHVRRF